ncbi:GAF domain-containing protein [Planomonospora parontospora]|uniref:GAF domain-containing protein n=1 Tax=Planomonospora parontospora TaxID=58119 RepID=UPI0035A2565D
MPRGKALPGLARERGEPVWIADLASDPCEFSRGPGALEAGLRSAMALPVRSGDHVLGVLIFGAGNGVVAVPDPLRTRAEEPMVCSAALSEGNRQRCHDSSAAGRWAPASSRASA